VYLVHLGELCARLCACSTCVCVWFIYYVYRLHATVTQIRSVRFRPVIGDLDWYSLWTRYIGDSKIDTQDDPEIHTVRTVKTKQRFGSKNASFHVSVCSCVISLFTVVNRHIYATCIISCD